MKTKQLLLSLALALASSLQPSALLGAPLGTAFTYQGRLNDGNAPAQGIYDLRIAIYDAAESGLQIGSTGTNSSVIVSNGLFTVTLDLGEGVFIGDARWLEIGVRTNGSPDDFTMLSPRQSLTPTPYALYSPSAGTAATAEGVAAGAVTGPGIATGQVVRSLNGLQDSVRLLPGTNVSVVSVGDAITVSATPGTVVTNAGWGLSGNSGTAANNFVGTLDGQALELRVNNARALRIEPQTLSPNLIGGVVNNAVRGGAVGVVIAGGGNRFVPHEVVASYGTVGGGLGNSVAGVTAVISGGSNNSIQTNAENAAISGGVLNTIGTGATNGVIGGGENNAIANNSRHGTIGGGYAHNIGANAYNGTVGGGFDNNIGSSTSYGTIAGGIYNDLGMDADSSTVGGGRDNNIAEDSTYATIAGGYLHDISTNADYAVIGGGYNNNIGNASAYATIPGGGFNDVGTNADYAVVAGGYNNNIGDNSPYATISGGYQNHTEAARAVIAGGENNAVDPLVLFETQVEANHAALVGGVNNTIEGAKYSFLGGGLANRAFISDALVLGGGASNRLSGTGSFLGGGYNNTNASPYSALVAGQRNLIDTAADYSFLGGGRANLLGGSYSVIAGGRDNIVASEAMFANLGGGSENSVSGDWATIGGGWQNSAAGLYATVPGGEANEASGMNSLAAGNRAKARHWGSFVWADGTSADFASTAENQFLIRANRGVGINNNSPQAPLDIKAGLDENALYLRSSTTSTNGKVRAWFSNNCGAPDGMVEYSVTSAGQSWLGFFFSDDDYLRVGQGGNGECSGKFFCPEFVELSDRSRKTEVEPVDPATLLAQVLSLPISTWSFTNRVDEKHVGPMAQDFHAAFGLGSDDKTISARDVGSVALAAIQGLNQKLENRSQKSEVRSQELEAKNAALEKQVAELKALVKSLAAKVNGGGQ